MNEFISGAMCMGYFVAAVYFLKFWKRSSDALFLLFSIAFCLLALQRGALSFRPERMEDDTLFYVVRLAAFLLIIVAIWQKNRGSK